jgi:hypothetical protein
MKSIFLVVVSLVFGILIGLISHDLILNPTISNASPTRPDAVPKNAVWSGGVDGGMWIFCESNGLLELECKAYSDVTGVLVEEGIFVGDAGRMKPVFYSEGMIDLRTRYIKREF